MSTKKTNAKDEQIARMLEEIAAKDEQIARLLREIAAKDEQIARLLEEIPAMRVELDELKGSKKVKKVSKKGQPRPNVKYVLVRVPTENIQPQGIAVAKILAMAKDQKNIPESEAMDLINEHAELLNTDQEPVWRIFQYYRPRLIEMGCLLMP